MMAMTGKYAVDGTPVTISDKLEAAILFRLERIHVYDAVKDVEFHCCADGIVMDVPVKNGTNEGRYPLTFGTSVLERGSKTWIAELKVVYDGKAATANKRRAQSALLFSMPAGL